MRHFLYAVGSVAVVTIAVSSATEGWALPRTVARDPVPYCRAVGTIDYPDKRYRGPKVPDWMYHITDRTKDDNGYVAWRCLDHEVLTCTNGGITGQCDKEDLSRIPTNVMRDECRANPNERDLSAAVVGHYTVYAWNCVGTTPVAGRAYDHPDHRGFRPGDWTRAIH